MKLSILIIGLILLPMAIAQVCPNGTIMEEVTCECAKNTREPCMSFCFECLEIFNQSLIFEGNFSFINRTMSFEEIESFKSGFEEGKSMCPVTISDGLGYLTFNKTNCKPTYYKQNWFRGAKVIVKCK